MQQKTKEILDALCLCIIYSTLKYIVLCTVLYFPHILLTLHISPWFWLSSVSFTSCLIGTFKHLQRKIEEIQRTKEYHRCLREAPNIFRIDI